LNSGYSTITMTQAEYHKLGCGFAPQQAVVEGLSPRSPMPYLE
jgi:hypothetical protein